MEIKKVLVANRGEIAIRIFRACVELGIQTVSVYTHEDRYSLHRYKSDESYQIGGEGEPLKPYLDYDAIINVAKAHGVDAIHPGYGFLSENSTFARKCRENGIIFVGPSPEVMDALGDKVTAKKIAQENQIPLIESSKRDLDSVEIALEEAQSIGFPVMLKAASGGGGRGMRVIRDAEQLKTAYRDARSEAAKAFGDDTVFLEKYVENPKHIEIQIAADQHGNIVHLYERDCSVQRRFQKVVEVAPSFGLPQATKDQLYEYAVRICSAVGYNNVGTVEFLVDTEGKVYFIEVNPRIQVEHTVTEMITGFDLIKTQLFVAGGYKLSDPQISIENQAAISTNGYAIQCRVTTEDPQNDFKPDYGTIVTYRSAAGFGIRLDAGSVYQGVTISPFFDSMLVKVSAHARTLDGACRRMNRALLEFRIRGVKTNIQFLENIIGHAVFREGKATVNFIGNYPELFQFSQRLDRATKAVSYLADVTVNGHNDVKIVDRERNKKLEKPVIPSFDPYAPYPKGTKDLLTEMGPEKFANWVRDQKQILFTDTTMRDGHQSLLATRMRSYDMLDVAESFAKNHPEVFSLEVWGGATFDVCLRFLYENPWRRLRDLRKAAPNILLQMLFRGSNGVGYSAYPDNLIEEFVKQSWENGVDVFRIFDSLNWMKAMAPSIEYVRKHTYGIAEGTVCYTGDILNPAKTKYDLKYYIQLAKDLENAGAHMLAVKDMAGLLTPYAATELIGALKSEINLPIHLHTHDTAGIQSATYLKAIEAGVDVVDCALGGLSGLTAQPNFASIANMTKFTERASDIDVKKLNEYGNYWETVRRYYYPFESGLQASSADVYDHEIPGGQYSNLKGQAIALGLGDRFEEVKKLYAEVNEMFGDIVKVTPSSKVVGDMAQFMVSNNLTKEDIFTKGETLSFPESVQDFFLGMLGQPAGGFPKELQRIVLKDKQPITDRPNAHLEPIDFEAEFQAFIEKFQQGFDRKIEFTDFLSYQLYPKVFEQAHAMHLKYGNMSRIPTKNFFFGMEPYEETIVEIADGKNIIVKLLSVGPANEDGMRTVFFKVNGQTRNIDVADKSLKVKKQENQKIIPDNPKHVGAPLQGLVSKIFVRKGQDVKKNDPLFVIEAMKMETTIAATADGKVKGVHLKEGTLVNADDLVISLD